MKIDIIGGGPAGMYFGILMKQADPAHEITVYERNGPDDTFGWGVVFSGKTLAHLREADEVSYRHITAAFAAWDNVDVVHQDRKSTRLNSSHLVISYAVFCLKKKKNGDLLARLCFHCYCPA